MRMSQKKKKSQQFKDKFGVVECTGDAEVYIKKKKRVNRWRMDTKNSGYFKLEKNFSYDIISLSRLEEEIEVAKEVLWKIREAKYRAILKLL